jgi:hypothetical protein
MWYFSVSSRFKFQQLTEVLNIMVNVFFNCNAGGDIKTSLKNIGKRINSFQSTDEEVISAVESALKAVRDDLRSQAVATTERANNLLTDVFARDIQISLYRNEIRRLQYMRMSFHRYSEEHPPSTISNEQTVEQSTTQVSIVCISEIEVLLQRDNCLNHLQGSGSRKMNEFISIYMILARVCYRMFMHH